MSEICETCGQCGEEELSDLEKVDNFVQKFHEHGIECGLDMAKLIKDIHPDAIAIVPLYRSCIAIEQNDEDKKEGIATVHAYADPHWMGKDITIDTLRSDDFHAKFVIHGHREGPEIFLIKANNYQNIIKNGGLYQYVNIA